MYRLNQYQQLLFSMVQNVLARVSEAYRVFYRDVRHGSMLGVSLACFNAARK